MDGRAKLGLNLIVRILRAYLEPMIAKAVVGFSI